MRPFPSLPEHEFDTPSIELGVKGLNGQAGLLLRAPRSEALEWDLEAEIASPRRLWMEDRKAWWIAAPYYQTVVSIVLRTFPSVMVFGENEDRLLSRDGHPAEQGRLF
jgi:hypothetical protein